MAVIALIICALVMVTLLADLINSKTFGTKIIPGVLLVIFGILILYISGGSL